MLQEKNNVGTSYDARTKNIHANNKWTIDKYWCKKNGEGVARAIIKGSAKAISNGSFKDSKGTSASVLTGDSGNVEIISVNNVPGSMEDQSAYRSKLAGIAGLLAHIKIICEKYDIHKGNITLGLDGERVLLLVSQDKEPEPHFRSYDMIKDIQTKLQELPIQVYWK